MIPSVLLAGVVHGEPAGQRRAMAKAITLLESTRADHRAQGDELLTAGNDGLIRRWRPDGTPLGAGAEVEVAGDGSRGAEGSSGG